MIDTSTVNYAISKVGEALSKAAPHMQDVSDEYVRFVVTKAVVGPFIGLRPIRAASRRCD